ncbi:MAG: hypothetical protein NTZ03_11330 [Actinobacteria bacterium]|nr:hypothetical protein [Actinomycetota bacterium]
MTALLSDSDAPIHEVRAVSPRVEWRERLADIASAQDELVSSAQMRAIGIPSSTASGRLRAGRSWTRVLPGVHLVTGGRPDRRQRERAALLYSAPHGILAGPTVLRHLGVRAGRLQEVSDDHRLPESVHLLMPHEHHLLAAGYLDVSRTRRWPTEQIVDGLRMTSTCRAVADTARRADSAREVAVLVDECVRRGLTSLDELLVEVREGPRQGSATLRAVLMSRIQASRHSVGDLVTTLIREAGVAEPLWKTRLVGPSGEHVGMPLAWLDSVGVAIELAAPDAAFVATLQRYSASGVTVFPVSAHMLQADLPGHVKTFMNAVHHAARRPRPRVSPVPAVLQD